jgi:hypothetical protein
MAALDKGLGGTVIVQFDTVEIGGKGLFEVRLGGGIEWTAPAGRDGRACLLIGRSGRESMTRQRLGLSLTFALPLLSLGRGCQTTLHGKIARSLADVERRGFVLFGFVRHIDKLSGTKPINTHTIEASICRLLHLQVGCSV